MNVFYIKNTRHFPTIHCHLWQRAFLRNPTEEQDKSPLLYYTDIYFFSTSRRNCLCWPKII